MKPKCIHHYIYCLFESIDIMMNGFRLRTFYHQRRAPDMKYALMMHHRLLYIEESVDAYIPMIQTLEVPIHTCVFQSKLGVYKLSSVSGSPEM